MDVFDTRSAGNEKVVLLQGGLHDKEGVAQNESFVKRAMKLWTSYRFNATHDANVLHDDDCLTLPSRICTVYYSHATLKMRDHPPTEVVVITNACLYIVKKKNMGRVRSMLPLVKVEYLSLSSLGCEDGTPVLPLCEITVGIKPCGGEVPPQLRFFMNSCEVKIFSDIFRSVFSAATARLLPVLHEPEYSAENYHPLSAYHEHLRAEEEMRGRTFLALLKYRTKSLVLTLSNVSLMLPENDYRWVFVAQMLLDVGRRAGVLRELLKSCLAFEIQRAKEPWLYCRASSACFQRTGGFLRTNSLAEKIIEAYTTTSASLYARTTFGSTLQVFLTNTQCELFTPEEVVGWAVYVFSPIIQEPQDELPAEASLLAHLIQELEPPDSGTTRCFVGDMFFMLYISREITDPGRMGLAYDGLTWIKTRNLNRLVRVLEKVFNGTMDSLDIAHVFRPRMCVDGDENGIALIMSEGSVQSFRNDSAASANRCIDTLLATNEAQYCTDEDAIGLGVGMSLLGWKRRELAALNDMIGRHAIHLLAEMDGGVWELVMEEEQHGPCSVPLQRFVEPGPPVSMGDGIGAEVERLRKENAQLHVQMHELKILMGKCLQQKAEASSALRICQKRLTEQYQEMYVLRRCSTKGAKNDHLHLPHGEKNDPFV